MCGFISESRLKIFTFKIKLFDSLVGVKIIIFNLSKVGILHCEIMKLDTIELLIPYTLRLKKIKLRHYLNLEQTIFFISKYHLPLF